MRRIRRLENCQDDCFRGPQLSKGGRPKKIGAEEKKVLREIVKQKPLASPDELTAAFCARTGLSVHSATVRKSLHEEGELFTVPANSNGFVPLPKRWVAERTHGWNERARRLITHHDRRSDVSEAWVWFTGARMLARRLTTT